MDINLDDSGAGAGLGQSPGRVVLLSGGVGGARLARGMAPVLGERLSVVVNVGDDDEVYGLTVSADLDTVLYTVADLQGPHGWGVQDDSFTVMDELERFGVDTTFRLGDRDLALCLHRTTRLADGTPLSAVTAELAAAHGLDLRLLPATDDRLRTIVEIADGSRLAFQDYFVRRRHRDDVAALHFAGSEEAKPAPGVVEAIAAAELVVIAPSNPPLSIWPILAVEGIRRAVEEARRVIAVSPLFGGAALKGPADHVMAGLGLAAGTAGVLEAYDGLLTDLVVDHGDAADVDLGGDVTIHVADTRIADPVAAERFAVRLLGLAR
ncbi:MAG: 2-phospho-L-lactate transferase [Acidimicrobiia bacterium]|nr:2-phospho-L-lactate transferase [Acidimicrobiia bacterium]